MSSRPELSVVGVIANLAVRQPETVADILSEPLPGYSIRPLLARRAVHVLYGDSQSGKTFLTLDFAATITTGGKWQGQQVGQAPVLYVSAEGNCGLGKRLRALVSKYPGLPASPFRIVRQAVDLINASEDLLVRSQDLAEDQGALGLIVLDTLAQTLGGRDENGPDMALYVSRATMLAERTGAPVLIVHHAGKNHERGARGHSALRGNVDAIYRVTVDDAGTRTVVSEKSRDDALEPFCFGLDVVPVGRDCEGHEQTSCIVSYSIASSVLARRPLAGSAQKLLYRLAGEVAEAAGSAGRIASNGRPIIDHERLVATWQAARVAAGAGRTNPSYMQRPLAGLIDGGYMVSVGERQWTLL